MKERKEMETEGGGRGRKRERGEKRTKNNKISSSSQICCERYKTQYTGLSGHSETVIITDAQFLIYDASIQKALKTKVFS